MAVIQRWIDMRRKEGIRTGPLFCTLAGEQIYPQYVRLLLGRLAAKAGIEKRVHPHGFRHTHAVELVREGQPVNVISKQLGHSSSAVTARYIDHVANGEVIEAMRQRTWQEPGR
jgi:site-specific recombinase XerD